MKLSFTLAVLLGSNWVNAKAPKIYRCVQNDGTVVIQDRRCMITNLQQAKPKKNQKSIPKSRQHMASPSSRTTAPPRRAQLTRKKTKNQRSPYFTFGWDRFIPANWVILKVNTSRYEQLLLSRAQFKNSSQFEQGVKFSVYSNTMTTAGLDAFAQALELYHQIRDNSSMKLLDSQFKSHPNYKVFNIKYQNADRQLMLTEFYIDESNNDLFVVTVQAKEASWQANWQLAEQIIRQL